MYYCTRCHAWHKTGSIARSHKIYAKRMKKRPPAKKQQIHKYKPKKMPTTYKPKALTKKVVSTKRKTVKAPIQMIKPRPPKRRKIVRIAKKPVKTKTAYSSKYTHEHAKDIKSLHRQTKDLKKRIPATQRSANGSIVAYELKQVNNVILLWKKMNTHDDYGRKISYLRKESDEYLITKRKLNNNLANLNKYYDKLRKDQKFKLSYTGKKDSRFITLIYNGRYASIKKTITIDYPIPGIIT